MLIVDEALAVGDAKFQAKCFRRFEELVARGTTILLVTHSIEQITRHCDRAILLEGGVVHQEGPPKDVASREWGVPISMPAEVRQRVDRIWQDLGIS